MGNVLLPLFMDSICFCFSVCVCVFSAQRNVLQYYEVIMLFEWLFYICNFLKLLFWNIITELYSYYIQVVLKGILETGSYGLRGVHERGMHSWGLRAAKMLILILQRTEECYKIRRRGGHWVNFDLWGSGWTLTWYYAGEWPIRKAGGT